LSELGRREAPTASEHDLHTSGVLITGRRQDGAKLLHKALDRRHRVSINQFDNNKVGSGMATTAERTFRSDITILAEIETARNPSSAVLR